MVILKFLMAIIIIQWSQPETIPLGVLMGVSYLAVDSNGVLKTDKGDIFCNKFIILKPGKYEIVK